MSVCSPIDPCRCPLCGQANHCAMEDPARAQSQAPCWCTAVHFSAELLSRLPPAAKGQACICQVCAQSPGKPS